MSYRNDRAYTLLRRALILIEHRVEQTAPVKELMREIKKELEKPSCQTK